MNVIEKLLLRYRSDLSALITALAVKINSAAFCKIGFETLDYLPVLMALIDQLINSILQVFVFLFEQTQACP